MKALFKATAVAPANIAFIKYWGKADLPAQAGESLRIPANDSLSMNLSGSFTTTTVEFSDAYVNDSVSMLSTNAFTKFSHVRQFGELNEGLNDREKKRMYQFLDRIRERAGIALAAKVVTKNTFPKGAGVASSASGFAALTVAGFTAAGVELSEKELTIFARLGSGSACRSIPDGFVKWEKGKTSDDSYAYSLYPYTYWDLRDVLVIVDSGMKKVSTTEGHEGVRTSPYWKNRLLAIPERMRKITTALQDKDFKSLGDVIEEDCLDMHHVMQTQNSPLLYWSEATRRVMDAVRGWRNQGLAAYLTIDAGANVHVICEGKDENMVMKKVTRITGVESVVCNTPAPGAHVIEEHLF